MLKDMASHSRSEKGSGKTPRIARISQILNNILIREIRAIRGVFAFLFFMGQTGIVHGLIIAKLDALG